MTRLPSSVFSALLAALLHLVVVAGCAAGVAAQDPAAKPPTAKPTAAKPQDSTTGNHQFFELFVVPAKAKAGEEVRVELRIQMDEGWHCYGSLQDAELGAPISLEVASDVLEPKGEPVIPGGTPHEIPGAGTYFFLEGEFVLKQVFTVKAGARPGPAAVQVSSTYMACDDATCDPELTAKLKGSIEVLAGGAAAPAPVTDGAQDPKSQDEHLGNHQLIELYVIPAKAKVGEKVVVEARVSMDPGWHNYGSMQDDTTGFPTKFKVESKALRATGEPQIPPGVITEKGGITYFFLEGTYVLRQEFVVEAGTGEGEQQIQAWVHYMACDDNGCDADVEATLRGKLVVLPGGKPAPQSSPQSPPGKGGTQAAAPVEIGGSDDVDQQSLWLYLLGAVGAGLFALVMPCTYPMIPITISFFTKQAEVKGGSVLGLALIYGAGIILSFVLIGVLILSAGLDPQAFAAEWWINMLFGVLFVVFAFSLFGVLNLQPPQFLMNLSGKASGAGGTFGVLALGMTLCISSFTCTAPVLGLMIASGLQGGDPSRLLLGMAVFGLTMAAPFVWLSLVPGKMPRSGGWMNSAKILFGFIELAAALKFFSNADLVLGWKLIPKEVFLAIWAALFGIAGVYLLGLIKLKGEDGEIGGGRLLTGTACISLAFYFIIGSFGVQYRNLVMSAMLPPYSALEVSAKSDLGDGAEQGTRSKSKAGDHAPQGKHSIVIDDFDAAVQLARQEKKLLLVNFTGLI